MYFTTIKIMLGKNMENDNEVWKSWGWIYATRWALLSYVHRVSSEDPKSSFLMRSNLCSELGVGEVGELLWGRTSLHLTFVLRITFIDISVAPNMMKLATPLIKTFQLCKACLKTLFWRFKFNTDFQRQQLKSRAYQGFNDLLIQRMIAV